MASGTIFRRIVNSKASYQPIGPYSQAVIADRTLYASGNLGIELSTGKLVPGGAEAEARQALKNIGNILREAGASYETVVKSTVMLNDIADFAAVNKVYAEFFTKDCPARSCYAVGKLPLNGSVEIEVIAMVGDVKTVPASSNL